MEPAARQAIVVAIRQVRAGDRDAFRAVVVHTQRSLLVYVAARCHSMELAESVCQSTYIRAYEILDRFDESGNLVAWLCAIASRVLHEELRLRFDDRTRSYDALDVEIASRQADLEEPEPFAPEHAHRLQDCLGRLSQRHRLLIQKRYLDHLGLRELAQHMRTPHRQLANLLYRIRGKLRQCVEAGA